MMITYKENHMPPIESLISLYADCGWNAYADHPDGMTKAFARSDYAVCAYDDNGLAGVVRCVSDETFIVFVQDLLVFKKYRRKGIATALMRRVLNHYPSMRHVLLTDKDDRVSRAFYESLGFVSARDLHMVSYVKTPYASNTKEDEPNE